MIDYPLVNDELALLWMVNMGCIDMNAWTSRADRPDRPDWVIFDLDPSDDVGFAEVIEVALLVKQTLDLVGLESFPKTSGSRGIHVLVPIARRHGLRRDPRRSPPSSRGRSPATHPGLVTTEWTKRKRRGVLVDANQNGPGKTTATVYSVRPRAGAPVSTPLALGRGARGARPGGVHLRRGARARRPARRPVRAGADAAPVARGGAAALGWLTPSSGRAASRPSTSTGTGRAPALRLEPNLVRHDGGAARADGERAGREVAELLRDAARALVARRATPTWRRRLVRAG